MGLNLQTYVGPYLECENGTREMIVKVRQCERCHSSSSTPYCPQCGGRVVEAETITTAARVTWEDQYTVIKEALRSVTISKREGLDFFIPNVRREPPRDFKLEGHELALPLDAETAAEEQDWFERVFEAEMAGLAKLYGTRTVLQWGILRWYS